MFQETQRLMEKKIFDHQPVNQMKIQEVNKQLENMNKQEQRKGELLQVNLDLWGKDETIKEMKTREVTLQHKMEKLKQGIL